MDIAITNARVVLPDSFIDNGTVVVSGGLIADFGPSEYLPACGERIFDAKGAWLIPGLVDSHNDGIEEEINPRPRAAFPLDFAIANYELRAAASGVTTAFHAVMFADLLDKERSIRGATAVADAIHGLHNPLIDHEVLYRLDVWTPDGLDPMFASMRKARVQAMSLNDHTPGQGQYHDLDEFKKTIEAYLAKAAIRYSPEKVIEAQLDIRQTEARPTAVLERTAAEMAERPFVLLGHDPDSAEKVDELAELGVSIAEFPVAYPAARRARDIGQWITMGAPNIVRGGSTSGNLNAAELAGDGLLDILCGDYHAPCLLYAVLMLYRQGYCELPAAVAMITSNPADAFRLHDRGRIERGLLADLCLFTEEGGIPQIAATFKAGAPVYTRQADVALSR